MDIQEAITEVRKLRDVNKRNSLGKSLNIVLQALENSIPTEVIEEKIKELKKHYDIYNSDKRETKNIAKGYYIAIQKLQDLLENK